MSGQRSRFREWWTKNGPRPGFLIVLGVIALATLILEDPTIIPGVTFHPPVLPQLPVLDGDSFPPMEGGEEVRRKLEEWFFLSQDEPGPQPLSAVQAPPTEEELAARRDPRDEYGNSVLISLVEASMKDRYSQKEINDLTRLIGEGADPDVRDTEGRTPLIRAVELSAYTNMRERTFALIDFFVNAGGDVNARDNAGRTALIAAVLPVDSSNIYHAREEADAAEVVARLLAKGADPNAKDAKGTSAVLQALHAPKENSAILNQLLSCDLRPEAFRSRRESALTILSVPLPMLEYFLKQESWRWTQREKNEGLLASSGYVVGWPFQPVFIAGMDMDRVELLIRYGANVNARDAEGKNILMKYLSEEKADRAATSEMLRRLLALGFDATARSNDGNTLLTTISPFTVQLPAYLELLLQAGADVNARGTWGRTCLHLPRPAASMKVLLDAGADPDTVDKGGRSPLFYARTRDALELLIASGADVNRRDRNGDTPLLTWIRRLGYADGVRVLLQAGADPDAMAADGTSPRSLASGDLLYAPCFAGGGKDS